MMNGPVQIPTTGGRFAGRSRRATASANRPGDEPGPGADIGAHATGSLPAGRVQLIGLKRNVGFDRTDPDDVEPQRSTVPESDAETAKGAVRNWAGSNQNSQKGSPVRRQHHGGRRRLNPRFNETEREVTTRA